MNSTPWISITTRSPERLKKVFPIRAENFDCFVSYVACDDATITDNRYVPRCLHMFVADVSNELTTLRVQGEFIVVPTGIAKEVTRLGKSHRRRFSFQCYLSEEIPTKAKHLNPLIVEISNSKRPAFIIHSNTPRLVKLSLFFSF